MTNSAIEEPPKEVININRVSIEVKEVKVEGFDLNYLNKFFKEQKESKDSWSTVLEIVDSQCDSAVEGDYSDSVVRKTIGIIETYESGKYKDKKEMLSGLLNKLATSINSRKNGNILPKHSDFCPEIKKAKENMEKIINSFGGAQ